MNEGRLRVVNNITNVKRKHMSNINDQVRTRYQRVQKMVDKDLALDVIRCNRLIAPYKRSLVEIRGLQKCLKDKASCVGLERDANLMGKYGGITLCSLKKEVERLIADGHPRLRRIRRIEKLLHDGKEDGRLLNNDEVRSRVEALGQRSSELIPDLDEEDKDNNDGLVYTKMHGSPDLMKTKRLSSRLVLPPIGINKNLIQRPIKMDNL